MGDLYSGGLYSGGLIFGWAYIWNDVSVSTCGGLIHGGGLYSGGLIVGGLRYAISKKIASGIGALKRIRPFVPRTTLHTIFHSLIQPHFDYCSVVWGNCNKTLATKMQKLQNRSARVLTFSGYDTNADGLLQDLGWENLETQRQIHQATMVYKSINGLAPEYLRSKCVDRSYVSGYSLRDTVGKLAVPFPLTNYLRNSFSYSGAVTWNSLPVELRQANSLNSFRSGCNKFLSSRS